MQPTVLSHPPPDDLGAVRPERKPRRDIGIVIEIGDDNLLASAPPHHLADRLADQPDEGRRVHSEANLVRTRCIDERRHAFSGTCDGFVHFARLSIRPAALYVAEKKVLHDGIEHALGNLRPRSIVEENGIALMERRKTLPDLGDGELHSGTTAVASISTRAPS